MTDINKKLREICPSALDKEGYHREYRNLYYYVRSNDSITLHWEEEDGGTPPLSFAVLKQLSDFFDTVEITTQQMNRDGCDTCDHGANHAHIIYIEKIKKNFPKGKSFSTEHIIYSTKD